MIFINELKDMIMYRKKFLLPLDQKKKKLNNAIFLLTPNIESSIGMMKHKLIIPKYYESYYLERNAMFFINGSDIDDITNESVYLDYINNEVMNEGFNLEYIEELLDTSTNKNKEKLRLILPKLLDIITKKEYTFSYLEKRIPKVEEKIEELEKEYNEFKVLPMEEKMDKKRIAEGKGLIKALLSLLQGPVNATVSLINNDMFDDMEDFESDIRITIDYSKRALRYLKNEKRKLEDEKQDKKDFGLDIKINKESSEYLLEDRKYDPIIRKYLYKDRIRNNKEILDIYEIIRSRIPMIKRTYLNYEKYKNFNLIIDSYYYTELFFKNNAFKLDRGVDLYFDFLNRYFQDNRLSSYNKERYIFIPVIDWIKTIPNDVNIFDYKKTINPISIIYRIMKTKYNQLNNWKDFNFVFMGENSYFKINFSNFDKKIASRFILFINRISDVDYVPAEDDTDTRKDSPKAIATGIVDNIEKNSNINLNIEDDDSDETKEIKSDMIEKINNKSDENTSMDDTIQDLSTDEEFKDLLLKLSTEEKDGIDISVTRSKRLNTVKNKFLEKKIDDRVVKDILNDNAVKTDKQIPRTSLPIDSVNEGWQDMSFMNFDKNYKVEDDIIKMMYSFSDKSVPVVIRDFSIEDSSTSEDYKETYIFNLEDTFGKRFTVRMDIPKVGSDGFLILKGNAKAITPQRVLIPIIKTDEDTVQIVTDYNKIFIRRFGNKIDISSDYLLKTLDKLPEKTNIKIEYGDASLPNREYELMFDYTELSKQIIRIEDKQHVFIFNQKTLQSELGDRYKSSKDGFLPIGYYKQSKELIYPMMEINQGACSEIINMLLIQNSDFNDIYRSLRPATKYMYSRCSILGTQIPLIVVLSTSEGLTSVLKKAGIEFEFLEKKDSKMDYTVYDLIRFSDGYLKYRITLDSSLLMNGLKECNTEDYSIGDINNKMMWIDFLDIFGSRLLVDGLENFYEMMIDPTSREVLLQYELPYTYTELMLYANQLLCDNKFIKHSMIQGTRYRSKEIIAAYAYKAICDSYRDYKNEIRHNRKNATMSMKQSAVIDAILLNNTTSDKSDLNPVLEVETKNAITSKGPSGMNADRAYDLDKRAYDESMINILGLSTGFAGNVGVTRQSTIDMNVEGNRGYFKIDQNPDHMGVTKTLTVTEAITPFGVTSDDPMRSAMNFIQTADHQMRTTVSSPMLITNGADEALPYLAGDTYSFKAKKDGKILEKTDEYIIIEYNDKTHDFIDLRSIVRKNSAGGMYLTIQLTPDEKIKEGSKVKENQVIAYDPLSFSKKVGYYQNLSYNAGTLIKCAILVTEDGFEDSTVVDNWLSEALASEVVIAVDVTLPKTANIYNIVKPGDPIQEGDALLTFQNSADDEDISKLLRNITDEDLINELGRIQKKSKVTGMVEDVVVYRTTDKEELTPSLLKEVERYESKQRKMKNLLKKYDVEYVNRFNDDSLDPTGKLKDTIDGVKIRFFLKYYDKAAVGDKVVYFSALKGVISGIYPEGKEPYSEYRKDEHINSILNMTSVNKRMVGSILKNAALNKFIIELDRTCKDILNIPVKYFNE